MIAWGWTAKQQRRDFDQRKRYFDFQRPFGAEVGQINGLSAWCFTASDASERPFQQGNDVLLPEVSAEHQPHIARHIIVIVKRFHIRKAWIFQVFGASDDWKFIITSLEYHALKMVNELHSEVVFSPVLLFIDRFKLALEEPEHRVYEAFAVELAPLFNVLWGTLTVIHGFIKVGIGVDARAAVAREQLRKLVGNGILGRLLVKFVDFELYGRALFRVGGLCQTVVLPADVVEQRFFFGVVGGSNQLRTFEHDVFKVVSNACIGAISCSCLHNYVADELRFGRVGVQPNGHSVRKPMNTDLLCRCLKETEQEEQECNVLCFLYHYAMNKKMI